MDEKITECRMVNEAIINNASMLYEELEWFNNILDTRIKLYFGNEAIYNDISEIPPPALNEDSFYGKLIMQYQMNVNERILLLLSLIPHIKPELLDVFFTKNSSNSREFTEFGGRAGQSYGGFLPTGETALFILAGGNLEKRISLYHLFDTEHFFHKYSILTLENVQPGEPELSGLLTLSKEIIELVTSGTIKKPAFNAEFPARRITTELDWDDLVLDPSTREQVEEIHSWIRYGDTLLNDLELGEKIKPGYRSLFYGPSGTGKTFTASLLGKRTGKDVYKIDLASIISKFIGETEKNLEKIFSKAEFKDWILFFDEADALFGKRTKIGDAHDRFANQEISYLLQRVEDFSGVVILATNQRANLDDAFIRRFQSIIHFPMPGTNDRFRLWKNSFSEKTELEEKANLHEIASRYELSGGSIINVVRYATLTALTRDSRKILLADIIDGIKREYIKEGRTI